MRPVRWALAGSDGRRRGVGAGSAFQGPLEDVIRGIMVGIISDDLLSRLGPNDLK